MTRDEASDYREALKLALRKLKASDKLEAEVREALLAKGFTEPTTLDVLSFLKDRRFLDDRRTIENHIERRSGRRSIGKEKIRAELVARGASEDMLDTFLKAGAVDQEVDGAVAALKARFREGADRVKAGRFLAARGFDEEVTEAALLRFFASDDPA